MRGDVWRMSETIEFWAKRCNVVIRSPWQTETETHPRWVCELVPCEANWDGYPRYEADTLDGLVRLLDELKRAKERAETKGTKG